MKGLPFMKKIFSLILTLMLSVSLLLCFPIMSSAEQSGEYTYEIRDGGAILTKYIAENGKIVIPAELGGYPVVEIGETACQSPVYANPLQISSIELPSTLKKIGWRAFFNLKGCKTLTIPEGVMEIGQEAFKSLEGLETVSIPSSVTAIGENAFQFCASLKEINVATGNKSYSSQDGILFNASGSELIRFPENHKATEYSIPTTVKKIAKDAFHDCSNIKKITVPGSIGKIDEYAFFRCDGVSEVVLGEGINEIGQWAFSMCLGLKKINIPEGVTKIGDSAFDGNTMLVSVSLPSTLKTIGQQAFLSVGASKIDVPKGVTSIGAGAFWGANITEIAIPSGITKIEEGTFRHCGSLTRIFIPKSVKSIGKENFQIRNLKTIYYEGTEAEFKKISVLRDNDVFKEATVIYNSAGLPSTTDHKHNFANFTTSNNNSLGEAATKTGYCTICGEKSVEKLDATFTDMPTGITISAKVGVFPEDTWVRINKIDQNNDKLPNIQLSLSSVAEEFIAYNLHFETKGIDNVQPNGTVSLTFNIPEGYGKDVGVYFVADDGSLEAIPSEVSADGKTIVAQVSHFSTYAVCKLKSGVKVPVLNTNSDSENTTSDSSNNETAPIIKKSSYLWIIFVIAAVVICCGVAVFVVLNKNKFIKKKNESKTEETEYKNETQE